MAAQPDFAVMLAAPTSIMRADVQICAFGHVLSSSTGVSAEAAIGLAALGQAILDRPDADIASPGPKNRDLGRWIGAVPCARNH